MNSLVNHSGNRDRNPGQQSDTSGPRTTTGCTYCGRPGHSAEKCYKKERDAGMRPAAPSAYMADNQADDEPKPLAYHQAFLAAAATSPLAPIHTLVPTKDQAQARAPAVSPVSTPAAPPALQLSSPSIIFDTGAIAHMWGSRSRMKSYTAYPHPRWIGGISKYAHGSKTAVLSLDPSSQCPD